MSRDDGRKFGLVDASDERIDWGRVVQVHRGLAGTEDGHDAQGRIAACREHEAHVLVVPSDALDFLAEVMAETDHVVAGNVVAGGVNQNRAGTAFTHGPEPKRDNRCGVVHGRVPDVASQILELAADRFVRSGGRESPAESDRDDAVEVLRAVDAFGSVAVTAAPKSLDVERHNLGLGAFDGLGVVERELGDKRSLGNFAFGEDDDRFAVEEGVVNPFHGFAGVTAIDVNDGLAV